MTKPVQIINNYWLKETLLNGNPILDKFYKEDLIKMVNVLKTENKKYKEVINKTIKWVRDYMDEWDVYDEVYHDLNDLLILLEEVEHE